MAVIYTWEIPTMNAHIQSEGQENVIYTVHYRYVGTEESDDITYTGTIIGSENYTYLEGDPFTPYSNTEEFQNIVVGWLEGSLDIPTMQTKILANIQSQITPINEDLVFTWYN